MEKVRVTISINKESIEWIDLMIKKNIFYNVSHAFEYSVNFTKYSSKMTKNLDFEEL